MKLRKQVGGGKNTLQRRKLHLEQQKLENTRLTKSCKRNLCKDAKIIVAVIYREGKGLWCFQRREQNERKMRHKVTRRRT